MTTRKTKQISLSLDLTTVIPNQTRNLNSITENFKSADDTQSKTI